MRSSGWNGDAKTRPRSPNPFPRNSLRGRAIPRSLSEVAVSLTTLTLPSFIAEEGSKEGTELRMSEGHSRRGRVITHIHQLGRPLFLLQGTYHGSGQDSVHFNEVGDGKGSLNIRLLSGNKFGGRGHHVRQPYSSFCGRKLKMLRVVLLGYKQLALLECPATFL